MRNEAFLLEQARTQLIALAAIQHTLDEKQVAEAAKVMFDVCEQIDSSLDAKEAGLRWRYRALAPLWGFLLIFMWVLWVKYKRLKKVYVVSARLGQEPG